MEQGHSIPTWHFRLYLMFLDLDSPGNQESWLNMNAGGALCLFYV